MEKVNYKEKCQSINKRLKLMRAGTLKNPSFYIINGTEKNHTVCSMWEKTAPEAWQNCYEQLLKNVELKEKVYSDFGVRIEVKIALGFSLEIRPSVDSAQNQRYTDDEIKKAIFNEEVEIKKIGTEVLIIRKSDGAVMGKIII